MMTKHVLLLLLVLLSPRHNALDVATTRVAVTVTRSLPSILPAEAKAAWLKYAWKEGGGLPAVGSLVSDDGRERTLLPLFLREKLVERKGDYNNNHGDDDDDDTCDTTSVEYVLTSAGALSVDVVAASHEGRVTFAPTTSGSGTDLTWSVGFDCTARDWLWEAVTRYTVGTVASNLEALCATPHIFDLSAKHLPATPSECLDKWLELLETGDLGVPMPPPVVLDEGAADGTRVGYERLILPPGLRERVLEVERGEAHARVSYTVVNPSWLTCYPAHTHRGDVEFSAADGNDDNDDYGEGAGSGQSKMRWTIDVRPQRGGELVVRQLTNLIVPAFSRNLLRRLREDRQKRQRPWQRQQQQGGGRGRGRGGAPGRGRGESESGHQQEEEVFFGWSKLP
jgi:hypothetical protein